MAFMLRAFEAADADDKPVSKKQYQQKAAQFEDLWKVCEDINQDEKKKDGIIE